MPQQFTTFECLCGVRSLCISLAVSSRIAVEVAPDGVRRFGGTSVLSVIGLGIACKSANRSPVTVIYIVAITAGQQQVHGKCRSQRSIHTGMCLLGRGTILFLVLSVRPNSFFLHTPSSMRKMDPARTITPRRMPPTHPRRWLNKTLLVAGSFAHVYLPHGLNVHPPKPARRLFCSRNPRLCSWTGDSSSVPVRLVWWISNNRSE